MKDLERLGQIITPVRTAPKRGAYGHAEIARVLGISVERLQELEAGRWEDPSPRVLFHIAELFGLEYMELAELAGYGYQPSGGKVVSGQLGDTGGELLLQLRENVPWFINTHIDWPNRTYYCGNCGCPRSINAQCEAEQCPECGDDVTDLAAARRGHRSE